jgi:hypothetical protein
MVPGSACGMRWRGAGWYAMQARALRAHIDLQGIRPRLVIVRPASPLRPFLTTTEQHTCAPV